MRKTGHILLSVLLCAGLSSCRSAKEAGITATSSNPHLNQYVSTTDSTSHHTQQPAASSSPQSDLTPLRESVNPSKRATLGGLLRDILGNLFGNRH